MCWYVVVIVVLLFYSVSKQSVNFNDGIIVFGMLANQAIKRNSHFKNATKLNTKFYMGFFNLCLCRSLFFLSYPNVFSPRVRSLFHIFFSIN